VAELLLDLPISERPLPFKRLEHTFASLEEARAWLEDAEVTAPPSDRRWPIRIIEIDCSRLTNLSRLSAPLNPPELTKIVAIAQSLNS
jgi:hypothetical protein